MPPPRHRTWHGGSWEPDWWAGFNLNGITAYGDGAYRLIGGEEVTCLLIEKPEASATAVAIDGVRNLGMVV